MSHPPTTMQLAFGTCSLADLSCFRRPKFFSRDDAPPCTMGLHPLCRRIYYLDYRHSSYNAVLLYRGILSNAVFSKPKTALKFYLTRFFSKKSKKKLKKNFFWLIFFSNFFLKTVLDRILTRFLA